MTAAEAVIRAHAAGLTLAPDPGGLAVGGPKAARAVLLPVLRPLATEILALITRPAACFSGPAPCPSCSYVHGTLEPRVPCDGCGSTDRTAMLVMEDGARFCSRCLTGRRPEAPGRAETSAMPKGGKDVG